MAIINGYCTLAEFKAAITPAGQDLSPDAPDDAVIEDLIERASRRVDDMCGRVFYPFVATRYYDLPKGRDLWLEDDLLEVTTLTNGDTNAVSASEYKLHPANEYPKYALKLKDISSEIWEEDSDGSGEQVISLLGFWGYHERYATRGWKTAGTLGAAMSDTTGLSITLTAGHTLAPGGGQLIKVGTELMITTITTSTTATVYARGENGSTAATHLNGSTVYLWQYMEDITGLTVEVASMMYKSRYAPQAVESNTYMSGGGMVVTPRSLPSWAQEVINKYKRRV